MSWSQYLIYAISETDVCNIAPSYRECHTKVPPPQSDLMY